MKVYFSNNNPEGRENKIYMAVRCGSTNSSSGFLLYCTQIPLSTPKPRLLELQPSLSSSLDEWWESYREDIPLPFKETSWNTHTFLLKFHLPTLSPKATPNYRENDEYNLLHEWQDDQPNLSSLVMKNRILKSNYNLWYNLHIITFREIEIKH